MISLILVIHNKEDLIGQVVKSIFENKSDLTEEIIFHYAQSAYYEGAEQQLTIKYNDPSFNIWWPVDEKNIITSERDKKLC